MIDLSKVKDVEIITAGEFKDGGCMIYTIVFRVPCGWLNEYYKGAHGPDPDCFDLADPEEYREYMERLQKRAKAEKAWYQKLQDVFGWQADPSAAGKSASFKQNVGEIFTAVLMEKLREGEEE